MILISRFVPLLALTSTALAAVLGPTSTITLTNKIIAPDGFNRSASVINGIHPGPVITANKGDTLKINVVNQLSDPTQFQGTSIHWHGILQKGNNFMDGVVGVTQCPIAPNNSFQYVFNADTAGTYWYHSHFGVQYCDGVRGALVVYDPNDPHQDLYDVDDESTIISLTEWYHVPAPSITSIAFANSVLINGQGRYPGGPETALSVVNVQQGKRYRFRIFAMSCEPNFTFSIDGHNLTVIEADDRETQPHTVNTIRVLAGQRYSAVVNANQKVDNYWIRALPNIGGNGINTTFAGGLNSAILRYNGAPVADPTTSQQTSDTLLEQDLHPLSNTPVPGSPTPDGADYVFNITMAFDLDHFIFYMDNQSFVAPSVPVLLQIMNGARTAQELLPQGGFLVVQRNKTVQLNIQSGLLGGPHPFHLHGHTFRVVRSADTGTFNFLDPVERDTVNAGNTAGDYASIRFTTDNPGPWIFHCHIDFHLAAGLALVFAEDPNDTVSSLTTTPPCRHCNPHHKPAHTQPPELAAWQQLCPIWDNEPASVQTPTN